MPDESVFVCNCEAADVLKIRRLEAYGYRLSFGNAQATPGYTERENNEAGLVGVYLKQ